MVVTIYAKSKDEADELFSRHAHQFFDQDMNRTFRILGGGYRQREGDSKKPSGG